MDRQLLKACSKGDLNLLNHQLLWTPGILLATTPLGNNCLHIAAMLGHEKFTKEVWSREPSLFFGTNIDGETPLIAALMAANASLAPDMITAASRYMQPDDLEEGKLKQFNEMLLKVDRRGENALHHAMRNGLENLALQLLDIEPRLSEQVNKIKESPMNMAARRGCSGVVARLLDIPSSAHIGPINSVALHAAVKAGHTGIVMQLLKDRPELAYCKDEFGSTPLGIAVIKNNLEIVKIFLEHDPNSTYIKNGKTGETPFTLAAKLGFILIAGEIMSACPDSVYTPDLQGNNTVHAAISRERPDFVEYALRMPQLHRLINLVDDDGLLPLHFAASICDPQLLRSLLSHEGQDYTAVDVERHDAVDKLPPIKYCKMAMLDKVDNIMHFLLLLSSSQNESFMLLSNAIPSGWKHTMGPRIKRNIKHQAIQEVKSLTGKYTSNTSLVAALLATITFAAAFTLPGGFSSDPSDTGLPIFARKAVFQVFLISDAIAMCSSLAVAFLCILTTWEDLDFLLNYRKTTRALMWCAYATTAVAFGTGLFTVMAPKSSWLAVLILVLCSILPFLSKIIGEWPLLMLRYRLGHQFREDLIPNI